MSLLYSEKKKIIFNDKKKRINKLILKNLELENRLLFQVNYFKLICINVIDVFCVHC